MCYQTTIEREIEKYIVKLSNPETLGEAMDGLQKIVKSGQKEETITHQVLENLIELHPTSVILYEIKAWLYRQVGNREKALIYYQKSYNILPCKESLSEIFDCYYCMGQYDRALPIANQIVSEYGNSHKILVVKTKLKMYNHHEAIKLIEQSLNEIDTFENKYAEEALAFAGAERCFKIGKYKKALAFLKKAESSLKIGNGKHIIELRGKIKQKQKSFCIRIIIFLFLCICSILCCIKCYHNTSNSPTVKENQDCEYNLGDSISIDNSEGYDWTPEDFKKEHYDEWVVVKQAIDIQQKEEDIDFSKIDRLVKSYICSKKIDLPTSKYHQIMKIEEICNTKFDISGYDDSNFGMHIADGTSLLFEEYINWLLANEAKKTQPTGIDLNEEEEMVEGVMNAFTICCDTIGYAFQGSGGWHGYADVDRIKNDFKKAMYVAVLNPQKHKDQRYLLTPKHFKDECEIRKSNYKQDEWEDSPSSEKVKALLDNYYIAIKRWLEYRNNREDLISDPILKSDYNYITKSFAKEHYVHLKNLFGDIGLCSATMYDECYLHLDCSDKEMLSYSYEKAYNKYISKN